MLICVNLEDYRLKREALKASQWQPRYRCLACRRPQNACFCGRVKAFAPPMRFVILIHRDEARRTVATGRLTHLCLSNSLLLEGTDFTHDERVNALIEDPANFPVVLYPGVGSVDVSKLPRGQRTSFVPEGKQLVIFVLDGTWSTARKMRRLSRNLHGLPMIRFNPRKPSQFQVRRQPASVCLSTVESVHEVIDLLLPETPERPQDNLLEVFSHLVKTQLHFRDEVGHGRNYRSAKGTSRPRRGVRKMRPVVKLFE